MQKPSRNPFSKIPEPISVDPQPFLDDRSYPLPYISPYSDLFHKFSVSKLNSLKSIPFHYRSTIFHHAYVTKFRKSELLSKISVANELKEAGNRNFFKGKYDKAILCYEHGIGLFKYLEILEDNSIRIIVPETDPSDISARNGILVKLLLNYSLALIKMKNFPEAEVLLEEASSLISIPDIKIIQAICKGNNLQSTISDLTEYVDFLSSISKNNKLYSELQHKFQLILFEIQKESCRFFSDFFNEFTNEISLKPNTGFDLEFNVIQKAEEKYRKMIEFYQESEVLTKVIHERAEVIRVYSEMLRIKSLQVADSDDIMLAYAKNVGIDLTLARNRIKFECVKRSMMGKVFNKGNFNRRLLYQCIQETMTEFENASEIEDKLEKEYNFWKRNVIILLILALIVYLTTSPTIFNY